MPNLLKKFKISHRIYLLTCITLSFIIIIGGTSFYKMAVIGQELEEIAHNDIPLTEIISQITVHQLEQAILLEQGLRYSGVQAHNENHTVESTVHHFEELAHQVDEELRKAEHMAEEALSSTDNPRQIKEFKLILAQIKAIEDHHESYENHAFDIFKNIQDDASEGHGTAPNEITPHAGGDLTQVERTRQPHKTETAAPAHNIPAQSPAPIAQGRSHDSESITSAVEQVEDEQEKLDNEIKELLAEIESFTRHSMETALEHEQAGKNMIMTLSLTIIAASAILSFLLGRSISKPITSLTGSMKDLASGNLDAAVARSNFEDEIKDISDTMEVFRTNMKNNKAMEEEALRVKIRTEEEKRKSMMDMADNFDSQIGSLINSLAASTTQLQSSADGMKSIADETSQSSMEVAASTEEASTNVSTVASAMEEMSATSSEIASQITTARTKADDTSINAQKANETVGNLNSLAENIGEVVVSIQDIAEQTNLLALNATIEAARAGENGKGFAVVADEVKKLATETAQKTEEINSRISEMQVATRESVDAMGRIINNITEINESVTGVSAAVEEQNATTTEISRSISEASQGVENVSKIITDVQQGATETGSSANAVLSAAQEVSQLSETLKGDVVQFLDKVRSDNASQDAA